MNRQNLYKIIFVLIGMLGFIWLLLIRMHASAADAQDYFPMTQNGNNLFSETLKNALNRDLDPENNFIIVKYGYVDGPFTNFFYISVPKESSIKLYGEKYNNLTQFSVYHTGNGVVRCYQVNYLSDGTMGGIFEASMSEFQGCFSSNYSASVSYISNFQLYTDNTSTKQIVLLYDDGVSIPDGDTIREDTPKPNANDYFPDWTNAPSFDGSSVENALNSVYDGILWLGGNIKDSITGLGGYIVDSVMWGLQRIINTIRDKIDEVKTAINNVITTINGTLTSIGNAIASFKQSMENLKTTVEDFADLFIHPFDEEEFEEQMEDCELINQYNELIENCETIQQIFDYAEERDHFSLYIDFENPFADSEHKIIHSQISFDWLVPLRSVYRPFLWVCTLFECFVGGMRILGNIIGGKAK